MHCFFLMRSLTASSVCFALVLLLAIAATSLGRSSSEFSHPSARTSYPAPSSTICNISSQRSGLMIYAYTLQDGRAPGVGWQAFQYSDAGDSGVKIIDLTPMPGRDPPPHQPLACIINFTGTDAHFSVAGFAVNGVEAQADAPAITCDTTACDGKSAQASLESCFPYAFYDPPRRAVPSRRHRANGWRLWFFRPVVAPVSRSPWSYPQRWLRSLDLQLQRVQHHHAGRDCKS